MVSTPRLNCILLHSLPVRAFDENWLLAQARMDNKVVSAFEGFGQGHVVRARFGRFPITFIPKI
jgi:hypothetical protein